MDSPNAEQIFRKYRYYKNKAEEYNKKVVHLVAESMQKLEDEFAVTTQEAEELEKLAEETEKKLEEQKRKRHIIDLTVDSDDDDDDDDVTLLSTYLANKKKLRFSATI